MTDYTPTKPTRVRINPSRTTCEEIIRRILSTEEMENGHNIHFKNATDFMTYFESLYPSGPALTKQVQRAIKSMDLAKDDKGYFLLHKTKSDQNQEKELINILRKSGSSVMDFGSCEMLFLSCDTKYASYLKTVFSETDSISSLYITILESTDGLVFLTEDRNALASAINTLIQ